jgi:hypothetical protein
VTRGVMDGVRHRLLLARSTWSVLHARRRCQRFGGSRGGEKSLYPVVKGLDDPRDHSELRSWSYIKHGTSVKRTIDLFVLGLALYNITEHPSVSLVQKKFRGFDFFRASHLTGMVGNLGSSFKKKSWHSKLLLLFPRFHSYHKHNIC